MFPAAALEAHLTVALPEEDAEPSSAPLCASRCPAQLWGTGDPCLLNQVLFLFLPSRQWDLASHVISPTSLWVPFSWDHLRVKERRVNNLPQ